MVVSSESISSGGRGIVPLLALIFISVLLWGVSQGKKETSKSVWWCSLYNNNKMADLECVMMNT